MNIDLLLAHYEQVSDAPDAVSRLRRFVLNLAVRGRLVEQNPDDEPASELLKRIALEKARLIEAGEIKKNKSRPAEAIEKEHELPRSWEWVALGDVFIYDAGIKREPKTMDPDMWLLELKDVEKDTGRLLVRIQTSERKPKSTKSEFRVGDILYGKLRPYLNKVLVADEPGYSTTEIVALRSYLSQCSEYCALALRRPNFVKYVNRLGQGTKMPRLRTQDAIVAPFPLPPLGEQYRIVAKVNELMSLCDQLEEKELRREARRDLFTRSSINRLNLSSSDFVLFQSHVNFVLDNITPLTTSADQIKALRQTIINLAVCGKLLKQDSAEGTGFDLLAVLNESRKKKLKCNSGRKLASVDRVCESEKYLDLPVSWAWARVLEVGTTQTGKSPSSLDADLFGKFVPFVKPADLDGDQINYDGPGLSEEGMKSSRVAPKSTVLMVCIGTLGKVNVTNQMVCFNQQINSVTPYLEGLHRFLALALKASGFQKLVWSKAGKTTLSIISKGKWEVLPIPLPPLAEQHRIVAKVSELMVLCDQLEASLATCNNTRRRLLDTLLHEAL